MRQQCREGFGGVRHFRRNQLAVAFVDGFGPGVVGESTGEDTDPRSEVESFSEVKRYLKQMAQTSARIRDDEAPAMEIQHTEWAGPPSSRVQESLGHAPMEDQPEADASQVEERSPDDRGHVVSAMVIQNHLHETKRKHAALLAELRQPS